MHYVSICNNATIAQGDEHVHAHKPHSCPDQMEILEEKYSDVADLSGVMQRIAVSDVRHCPEAPKIQGTVSDILTPECWPVFFVLSMFEVCVAEHV